MRVSELYPHRAGPVREPAVALEERLRTSAEITYSRGRRYNDAYPEQRSAETFEAFAEAVLSDRAQAKGEQYIAAPMRVNGNGKSHRGKDDALPSKFLAFDVDGVADAETGHALISALQGFAGFAYTTASSAPECPRYRIVLAVTRPMDRTERQRVSLAVQRRLDDQVGAGLITWDVSVYRAEQPIFLPLADAAVYRFAGVSAVDVDAMLAVAPDLEHRPDSHDRAARIATDDPVLAELHRRGMVKRQLEPGKYAVVCPCSHEHTSESNETSTIYLLPSFGGVRYGKFNCLHSHCVDRPQPQFLDALGLHPPAVWAAQRGERPAAEPVDRPQPVPQEAPTYRLIWAHEAQVHTDQASLISGLITPGSMVVTYGESNSGKTFHVVDRDLCVAAGLPWYKRETEPGLVIYVAAEGAHSVEHRVAAYKREVLADHDFVPFAILPQPLDLFRPLADTQPLIDFIKRTEDRYGIACVKVTADTLARVMAGGNENSPEDMGALVRNADQIRHDIGCAFEAVHHSGKNTAKGARGHSSLRAATDTEIEVTNDDGFHLAKVTKQRDLPIGDEFGFRLRVVELGADRYGHAITTCVPEWHLEAPLKTQRTKLTKQEQAALRILKNSLGQRKSFAPDAVRKAAPRPPRLGQFALFQGDFENAVERAGGLTPSDKPDTHRKAFQRAVQSLRDKGVIEVFDGYIWLSDKPDKAGQS